MSDEEKKARPVRVKARDRAPGTWFKDGDSLVQREGDKKDGKILRRQDKSGNVTELTKPKEGTDAEPIHSPKSVDSGEGGGD